MSCWVTPSVAATYWGVSVESILESIRRKDIATKFDLGMTLIDVAPDSPRMESPVVAQPALAAPAADPSLTLEELFDWRTARAQARTLRTPPTLAA